MSEDRQVTGKLDIWDALSRVYNMDGVPDEAKSIIGDVMLCLQSEEPEPERNTASEQPVSDRLGIKTGETCTDTISRQDAIDLFKKYQPYMAVKVSEFGIALKELPSAQLEIIRCKECKYCEHWYADKGRCFLWHETGIDVFEDGFCNYAERRTDG